MPPKETVEIAMEPKKNQVKEARNYHKIMQKLKDYKGTMNDISKIIPQKRRKQTQFEEEKITKKEASINSIQKEEIDKHIEQFLEKKIKRIVSETIKKELELSSISPLLETPKKEENKNFNPGSAKSPYTFLTTPFESPGENTFIKSAVVGTIKPLQENYTLSLNDTKTISAIVMSYKKKISPLDKNWREWYKEIDSMINENGWNNRLIDLNTTPWTQEEQDQESKEDAQQRWIISRVIEASTRAHKDKLENIPKRNPHLMMKRLATHFVKQVDAEIRKWEICLRQMTQKTLCCNVERFGQQVIRVVNKLKDLGKEPPLNEVIRTYLDGLDYRFLNKKYDIDKNMTQNPHLYSSLLELMDEVEEYANNNHNLGSFVPKLTKKEVQVQAFLMNTNPVTHHGVTNNDVAYPYIGDKPITSQGKRLNFDKVWCPKCSSYGHSQICDKCPKSSEPRVPADNYRDKDGKKVPGPGKNADGSKIKKNKKAGGRPLQRAHNKPNQTALSAMINNMDSLHVNAWKASIVNIKDDDLASSDIEEGIKVHSRIGTVHFPNIKTYNNLVDATGTDNNELEIDLDIIADTGASATIGPSDKKYRHLFTKANKLNKLLVCEGIGGQQPISHTANLIGYDGVSSIPVYLIPGTKFVLVSISQVSRLLNASSFFDEEEFFMWDKCGLISHGLCQGDGLYHVQKIIKPKLYDTYRNKIINSLPPAPDVGSRITVDPDVNVSAVIVNKEATPDMYVNNFILEDLEYLHKKYNHRSYDVLRKQFNLPPATLDSPNPVCQACCEAQMKKPKQQQEKAEGTSRAWQNFSMDITRKFPSDKRGNQRAILVVDEYSDKWVPLFMRRKSDSYQKLEIFIKKINNRMAPYKISQASTDCDTVLTSKAMYAMFDRYGIELLFAPSHTQNKNPAENPWDRLQKATRASMFTCNAPQSLWSYAMNNAAVVHNYVENPVSGKKPIEIERGIKSSFKIEGVFGNKCLAREYNKGKLEKVAGEYANLGYDPRCRASIVRSITGKKAIARDRYVQVVKHMPDEFPWTNPAIPKPSTYASIHYDSDTSEESSIKDSIKEIDLKEIEQSEANSVVHDSSLTKAFIEEDPDADFDYDDDPPQCWALDEERKLANKLDQGFPLTLRRSLRSRPPSQKLIESVQAMLATKVKPIEHKNEFYDLFDPAKDTMWKDPTSYEEMEQHEMREFYLKAMMIERDAWVKRKVVKLVKKEDVPEECEILNAKSIWKTKTTTPGMRIEKFKYRLCVDGSVIKTELEFTYEPCVTVDSVRIFFDLIVRFILNVAATDISTFYLNSELRKGERYFMKIPKGWEEEKYYNGEWVYEILCAIYGLPTASQTAGQDLKKFLLSLEFSQTVHDPNVYFRWKTTAKLLSLILVLIHSDDLLWGYSNKKDFEEMLSKFKKKYEIQRRDNPPVMLIRSQLLCTIYAESSTKTFCNAETSSLLHVKN